MLLQPGDVLPRLSFLREGKPVRVEPGRGGLLLYFMRTADCPLCRAHVKRLVAMHPELTRQGVNVGVVVPAPDSEVGVSTSLRTPFPVVQGQAAHAQLGLERVLFALVQQSGTVVTDAAGRVTLLNRATNPASAFPEDAVWALLEGPGRLAAPAAR